MGALQFRVINIGSNPIFQNSPQFKPPRMLCLACHLVKNCGPDFSIKVVLNLKLQKIIFNKKCSPKL